MWPEIRTTVLLEQSGVRINLNAKKKKGNPWGKLWKTSLLGEAEKWQEIRQEHFW